MGTTHDSASFLLGGLQMSRAKESEVNWQDYFYYDETSPSCLRWKVSRGTRKQGDAAGNLHPRTKQWDVGFCKSLFRAHRIVYILFNEKIPDGLLVDHKDRNPSNNKINNLRLATKSQNNTNQIRLTIGKHRGVSKAGKKFQQNITHGGTRYYLGVFPTEDQAALQYNEKALELHGEFAVLNIIGEYNDYTA